MPDYEDAARKAGWEKRGSGWKHPDHPGVVHRNAREIYPLLPAKHRRPLSADPKPATASDAESALPKFDPADPIPWVIERAGSNPDKAEGILKLYCHAVERGGIPDQRVMDYLAKCFERILAGTEADIALGLVREGGQGKRHLRTENGIDERNLDLARRVCRGVKSGMSAAKAIAAVADAMRASRATVRDAYYEWRDHIEATGQAD